MACDCRVELEVEIGEGPLLANQSTTFKTNDNTIILKNKSNWFYLGEQTAFLVDDWLFRKCATFKRPTHLLV